MPLHTYSEKIDELRSHTKNNKERMSETQIKEVASRIRRHQIKKDEAQNASNRLLNRIHSIELVKMLRQELERSKDTKLTKILSETDGDKIQARIQEAQKTQRTMDGIVQDVILTLSGGTQPQPPTDVSDPEVDKIYKDLINDSDEDDPIGYAVRT